MFDKISPFEAVEGQAISNNMEGVKDESTTEQISDRQAQNGLVEEEKYSRSESEGDDVEEHDESEVTEDEAVNNPFNNGPVDYNQGVEEYIPQPVPACNGVVKEFIKIKSKLDAMKALYQQESPTSRQENAGNISKGENEETEVAEDNDFNMDSNPGVISKNMEGVKAESTTEQISVRQDQNGQEGEDKFSNSETEGDDVEENGEESDDVEENCEEGDDVEENDEGEVTEEEPVNNSLDTKPVDYNQVVAEYVPQTVPLCNGTVKGPIKIISKLDAMKALYQHLDQHQPSTSRQENAGNIIWEGENQEIEAAEDSDSNIDSDDGSEENNEAQGNELELQPYSGAREKDQDDQELETFVPHVLTVCKNFTDTMTQVASRKVQIEGRNRQLYVIRDHAASKRIAAKEELDKQKAHKQMLANRLQDMEAQVTMAQVEVRQATEKYKRYVAIEEEVNKRLRSSVKELHKYETANRLAIEHLRESKCARLLFPDGEDANIMPIEN